MDQPLRYKDPLLLPDDLKRRIFLQISLRERRTVLPLVSKGWAAFIRDPNCGLWDRFAVDVSPSPADPFGWERAASWIGARASGTIELTVRCPKTPNLDARPAQFLRLLLNSLLSGRLKKLTLIDCTHYFDLPGPSRAAFGSLSQLVSLQGLHLYDLPLAPLDADALNQLGSLTALTTLVIVFEEPPLPVEEDPNDALRRSLRGGFPTHLSRLQRLESLVIKHAGPVAFQTLPPCLSSLTALQVLSLDHTGADNCGTGIQYMPSLKHLWISCWMGLRPPLTLPAPLHASLETVILCCEEVPLALSECKNLQALSLACLDQQRDPLEAAFAVVLEGLTRLTGLHLDHCSLLRIPPAVANLSSLVVLDVGCNLLATIPEGPYLQSLEVLGLYANPLLDVPAALASGAPNLRVLDLSCNYRGYHTDHFDPLEISSAGAEVLCSLPRLKDLWLARYYGWSGPSVQALARVCARRGLELNVDTTDDDVHPELLWCPQDHYEHSVAASDLL